MRGFHCRLFTAFMISFSAIMICVPAIGQVPPQIRTIVAKVQVVSSDDQTPLASVPVAMSAKGSTTHQQTDMEGKARLELAVSTSITQAVVFFPQSFPWVAKTSSAEATKLRNSMESCEDNWSLPDIVVITLQPNQAEYDIVFVAKPAVKLTAKFVDSNGKPCPVFADRPGRPNTLYGFLDDGILSYRGVPKGESSFIFAYLLDNTQKRTCVKIIAVSAEQALVDIDLGTVAVTVPQDVGRLKVTLANPMALFDSGRMSPAVTLVEASGSMLYVFPADKATGSILLPGAVKDGRMPVPPGTYYVFPSLPSENPLASKFLRMLRAGRAAYMEQGGIVKLVILEGQPVDVTIDAADLQAKIGALVE